MILLPSLYSNGSNSALVDITTVPEDFIWSTLVCAPDSAVFADCAPDDATVSADCAPEDDWACEQDAIDRTAAAPRTSAAIFFTVFIPNTPS